MLLSYWWYCVVTSQLCFCSSGGLCVTHCCSCDGKRETGEPICWFLPLHFGSCTHHLHPHFIGQTISSEPTWVQRAVMCNIFKGGTLQGGAVNMSSWQPNLLRALWTLDSLEHSYWVSFRILCIHFQWWGRSPLPTKATCFIEPQTFWELKRL